MAEYELLQGRGFEADSMIPFKEAPHLQQLNRSNKLNDSDGVPNKSQKNSSITINVP